MGMGPAMKAVHVAEMPMDIVPSEVMRLLATDDGRTFGYGYGPGWSLIFGSEHGDVIVHPGQWVIRHDDGLVTVQDHEPIDWRDDPANAWCKVCDRGLEGCTHEPAER